MAKDYIPRAHSKFNILQQNITKAVVANAAAWNIPLLEVTALQTASVQYAYLFKVISNRSSCTTAQRQAHTEFRSNYEKQIRKLVNGYLRDNKNIDSSELTGMGIKVRGKRRSSKSAITTAVELFAVATDGCRVKFYCRIEKHDGKASMHPESDAVEIRYALENKPQNVSQCPHSLVSKKAHVRIEPDITLRGKYLFAFARWVNLSNSSFSGPWGNMATVMLH